MRKIFRNPLAIILFTVFLDTIGFGVVIPVVPLLLAAPDSPYFLLPKNFSVSDGYILLGFLTAIFPLGQFFSTSILGEFSDKVGRKKVLLISLSVRFVSYASFAIGIATRNIPLLFVSRFMDGIASGNISVAQAAIADVTDPAHRAKNFGLMGAVFGIGFIVGPLFGGLLSDPSIVSWFSAITPFLFVALLVLLNIIFVVFFFEETLKDLREHIKINWGRAIHNIISAYSHKKLRVLFLTNFLYQSGFSFFVTFFSVFLILKFSFNQADIGKFFAYIGLCISLSQTFLVGRVSKRFPDRSVLRVALPTAALTVGAYLFVTEPWQFIFLVPLFAGFNSLIFSIAPAIVSKSVDSHVQGEILGVNASVQAIAQTIPPVLSGFIASSLTPETPILVASVVMLLAGFVFYFFYKPVKV